MNENERQEKKKMDECARVQFEFRNHHLKYFMGNGKAERTSEEAGGKRFSVQPWMMAQQAHRGADGCPYERPDFQ